MTVSHIVSLVFALALARIVCYGTCAREVFAEKWIPGPLLARWTPLWLMYQARHWNRSKKVNALHQQYGKVVRIAPNHVSVACSKAVQVIYASLGQHTLPKSQFYSAFVSGIPSVFSTTDKADHSRKRRSVSHVFSARSVETFSGFASSNYNNLRRRFHRLATTKESFNIVPLINYLGFDVLSDLVFGKAFGMIDQGSDLISVKMPDGRIVEESIVSIVEKREHAAAIIGIAPYLKSLGRAIPDPYIRSCLKDSEILVAFARLQVMKKLDDRRNNLPGRLDMMHTLIESRMKNHKDEGAIDIEELVAEVVTLLVAGSDTISSTLVAAIFLVVRNHDVHEKLLEELQNVASTSEDIVHDQLKDLTYLQAVINETYFSTVSTGLPRVAPKGGLHFEGYFIPEGTEVSVPAGIINHSKEIWGDPEVFRPERWIQNPELRRFLMTFGQGSRACVGRHLAYMELRYFIAAIFLEFDIIIDEKHSELGYKEGFANRPLDLKVKISRRTVDKS